MKRVNFSKFDKKWQKEWEKAKVFEAKEDSKKEKYYCLEMYAYPSGTGLHMGHAFNYTIGDVLARFMRMNGKSVLHPVGYDSFGLPAENAAIKDGTHPRKYTDVAIKRFIEQQKALGLSYDWSRKIQSHDLEYYKWNQYFFLQFLKKGLAYRKNSSVNWCPKCDTVLANEQVTDGKCYRHKDTEVSIKQLEQWFFKTTKYADELLSGLGKLDWPERIKAMQRNWIGKSEGTEVLFEIPYSKETNFVLLHGYGSSPKDYPWLENELKSRGYKVQAPILAHSDKNNANEKNDMESFWKQVKLDENSIIVAVSLGNVVALKALEKINHKIRKLVLVAGFIEPRFKDKSRPFDYNWKFDFEKIRKNCESVIILHDLSDCAVPIEQAHKLHDSLGGQLIKVTAKGSHFTGETEPEILNACLEKWSIFTTRIDTLFGVSFLVISAQHSRLDELVTKEQKKYVNTFLNKVKSTKQEDIDKVEKEGVFTGSYAIHPLTGKKIPIWVGNFVVADYGSGMVMGVPAHDARDFDFAKKYGIDIKHVVGSLDKKDELQDLLDIEFKRFIAQARKEDKMFFVLGGFALRALHGVRYRNNKDIDLGIPKKDFVFWKRYFTSNGYEDYREDGDKKRDYSKYGLYIKNIDGKEVEFDVWVVEEDAEGKYFDMEWGKNRGWGFGSKDLVYSSHYDVKLLPKFVLFKGVEQKVNEKKHIIDKAFSFEGAYTDYGILINSGDFNGLTSEEAIKHIQIVLKEKKLGGPIVNYKLRDWLISRQRYWGTPIPIIYCDSCGTVPVDENDLPVLLPEKVTFGKGNPLLTNDKFVNAKCPKCGKNGKRETDTMDTFIDSSWYYLRFTDSANSKLPLSSDCLSYWMPVDFYIGGSEHACGHLIYSRFITKALRDFGYLNVDEPFQRLFNQGMIHGEDGFVMSKSRGNVVDPLDMTSKYGTDALRLFLVSMSSPDKDSSWSSTGLESVYRFVNRLWNYAHTIKFEKSSARIQHKINKAIVEIENEIKNINYNIAVIKLRTLFDNFEEDIDKSDFATYLQLLAPFAPHICEELWHSVLGYKTFVSTSSWPVADSSKINDNIDKQEESIRNTINDINNLKGLIKVSEFGTYLYTIPNEKNQYSDSIINMIENSTGSEFVKVYSNNESNLHDPQGKAKKAKPGKPGIYIEPAGGDINL